MTRTTRDDPDGGWHHVMNRGSRRYDVFIDDEDRHFFLRATHEATARVEADLVAWCLMDNHYHLLVYCKSGGLSRAMQRLGSRYTKKFNRDHGFDGPLFRSRFTSVAIDTEQQLIAAARYIHRNPLELGFALRSYSWSNFGNFVRSDAAQLLVSLAGGQLAYEALVESDLLSDKFSIRDGQRPPRTVGRSVWSLADVDAAATAAPDIDEAMGVKLGVLLAVECGRFSSAEIASHYGLKSAGVARTINSRARRQLESSARFSDQVASVRRALQDHSSLAA